MRTSSSAAIAAAIAALVMGVSGSAASAPPAAGPASLIGTTQTVSKDFSTYRYVWVKEFNFCLGVYVTGTMRADYTRTASPQQVWKKLHKPRIIDPKMQVTIKTSCDDNASLKSRHRANVVAYKQYFYGYSCSYNPSFSVSVPWSVGGGLTPDCGSKTVARFGDRQTSARRANRFKLSTSGYALGWNQSSSKASPGEVKVCTSRSGFFELKDTDGADRERVLKRVAFPDVCITK